DNEEGCYREDWDNEERGYETINRYYQRCCVKPREVDSDSLQTRSSCRLLQASSVENAETKSCHPSENIDPAAQPCIPGQHQTAPDQHNERDPKLGKHRSEERRVGKECKAKVRRTAWKRTQNR